MIHKPKHFDLQELVCPHVYYKFGEMAWQFLDQTQLILMDWIRDRYDKPVYVNNWYDQYLDSDFVRYVRDSVENKKPIFAFNSPKYPVTLFSQRGLRCNICGLNYSKTHAGIIYVSPHFLGKADDFNVEGKTAKEVRSDLDTHQLEIPYNIRLEKNVTWVHLDCEDTGQKVFLFNP